MFHLKLYWRFIRSYMKTQLEYRFAFFGDIFANMLTFITLYLSFWVLFEKFQMLNGWSYWEVVFLYNLNLLSYAVSSLFLWGPMKQLESMVHSGEFDNFLIRPFRPLTILVIRQFQHTFIGHIIVACCVLALCTVHLHIQWDIGRMLFVLMPLVGGTLIQAAIIIIAASSAFWIVRSGTILDIAIYTLRSFINYPISIYGKSVQLLLTFVIPYAFVNYYPSASFFAKDGYLFDFYACGSILVGGFLFLLACWVFSRGVLRYDSAGS